MIISKVETSAFYITIFCPPTAQKSWAKKYKFGWMERLIYRDIICDLLHKFWKSCGFCHNYDKEKFPFRQLAGEGVGGTMD